MKISHITRILGVQYCYWLSLLSSITLGGDKVSMVPVHTHTDPEKDHVV